MVGYDSIFAAAGGRKRGDGGDGMKHRRFAVAVWSGALLALAAASAWAQKPSYPEIEYVSPDQSVWTTKLDARGEPENPLYRLADALFAKAGIPWHAKTYPSARMFKYLQDGSAQFSMLVKAPALQECCLWSRKPVAVAEIRVYRLGAQPPVRSRDDLVGHSVIVVRGYSYAGLKDFIVDPRQRIVSSEAPTHEAAFKMLALGRADYLVDYAGPAADTLAAAPVAEMRSDSLSRQAVYLVLSKRYPDADKVMARLEAIAEALDKESPGRFPSR